MSKPNLLSFRTSIGFFRNPRVLSAREEIGKAITQKIPFADLAPLLFQIVLAYAAENQLDGDFSGYSAKHWHRVFTSNNCDITEREAVVVVKAMKQVGLFDGDKIRSWSKFNWHLAEYESLRKSRRRAGKLSAKKRELYAKRSLQNGHTDASEVAAEHKQFRSKTPPKTDSPSKQLWLIDKALEGARGKARRELLQQREQLLSAHTGVDLSPPAPSPAPPPGKSAKLSPKKWEEVLVSNARQLIADGAEDVVTPEMARALVKAGVELPPSLRARYAQIASGKNPVPG